MRERSSIATTMGFTALDGLPMGTRCGDLDAGVVLHLMQQKGMSVDELVSLLYRRSGMLGLSGVSADFRELLTSDDPRARFAIELFCYRVAGHIGSLAAALGGIDGIVFTAVSARMRRRYERQSAAPAVGWVSSWTKRPIMNTGSASARAIAASLLMSSRPTRT
jgi:acetate kinase